uniref:Protein NLRC3-like n=1 Tax=Phallusia mammillata TaxID=59560 RepID=A0A6F9DMK0_9ASCI|nr:protein NLRC3-like [Phallusia mammillata]
MASCIYNIVELHLVHCQLTSVGIRKIAEAISKLSQPMKTLDISRNSIDEEAEKCLFGCLHKIQDELKVDVNSEFKSKYSKLPEPKPKLV